MDPWNGMLDAVEQKKSGCDGWSGKVSVKTDSHASVLKHWADGGAVY